MRRKAVLIIALLSFLSGCATMFASKSDTITIKTEPPGAEVYYGAELLGETPVTHSFKRDTFVQKTLQIRKSGYATHELQLQKSIEPVAFFNLGFILTTMGATSWGIDAATGAMIRYEPSSYFVDLVPIESRQNSLDQARDHRMRFVLLNYQPLRGDIANGNGEYLRAYYSLLLTPGPYDDFVTRIQNNSADLLAQKDGVDLLRHLEVIQYK